jgi:hypothetical protein
MNVVLHFAVRRISILALVPCLLNACSIPELRYNNWEAYRRDDGINAYSSLDQINTFHISSAQHIRHHTKTGVLAITSKGCQTRALKDKVGYLKSYSDFYIVSEGRL